MIGPLAILCLIGMLIWSIFAPHAAAWTFVVVFVVLFEGWLLTLVVMSNHGTNPVAFEPPFMFTPDEVAVIKKYSLLFRFPFASRESSGALSMIGLSSFLWVPWLAYNGLWVLAAIVVLNYFVVGPLSAKLSPSVFLNKAASQGAIWAEAELMAIQSAFEKLNAHSRAARRVARDA